MADSVHWIVDMVVQPGQLDAFKTLMAEMVESTKTEPGVLDYEWSLGPDGQTVSIHERYRDVESSVAHSAKFREKWAPRFFAMATPGKFIFFGEPGADRRARLKCPIVVLEKLGGFSRHQS